MRTIVVSNSIRPRRFNIWVSVIEPTFYIRVTLEPPQAVAEGAQWSVDGGMWIDSGDFVDGLDIV